MRRTAHKDDRVLARVAVGMLLAVAIVATTVLALLWGLTPPEAWLFQATIEVSGITLWVMILWAIIEVHREIR